MLSRYTLVGRRRGGRRDHETHRIYVDRFTANEWKLSASVVVLSIADMLLTLRHLAAGGAEANPLMALAIDEFGTPGFLVAKLSLSVVPVAVLLLHIRFPLARRAVQGLVLLYFALMLWHAVVAWNRGGV